MVARNESYDNDRYDPNHPNRRPCCCSHCLRLQHNPHSLPRPAQWFIVISLAIVPGLVVLSMAQSRHENLRVAGWMLVFALWVAMLVGGSVATSAATPSELMLVFALWVVELVWAGVT